MLKYWTKKFLRKTKNFIKFVLWILESVMTENKQKSSEPQNNPEMYR